MVTVLGAIGAFYGVETSSTFFTEIIFGCLYAFVGVWIAVPLAFAINVTRQWIWLAISRPACPCL
jgi:hypothetical protein